MSDRAAFVSAIAAAPDDDLPKLVFADWLEENGDPARAEFIRLQIAARKEANQYPPVIDEKKLARIRELFLTNYRDWLRPVYDALAEPLPVFEDPPTNLFSRLARGVRNLARPAAQRPTARSPKIMERTLTYAHTDESVALKGVGLHGGVLDSIYFVPDGLQPAAELGDMFAAEPIHDLTLSFTAQIEIWWRINGPHLRRVRILCLKPYAGGDTSPSDLAEEVCGSEHLGGLRDLGISSSGNPDGTFCTALFDTLRRSPLRRQIERLELDGIGDVGGFLTDPDSGFDALGLLSVQYVVPPGEADLFGGGVSARLRQRLWSLSVSTPVGDVHWLTSGPVWEKLEWLTFEQAGLGPASLGAIGRSTLLPALRHLWLIDPHLTDSGLTALARCPLVERLYVLAIEGPTVGDDAVRSLAASLLCGLRYLKLRGVAHRRLWRELTTQYPNRIELHTSDATV